ncbi:capsule assembly Wzi family protein [Aliikangiella maris]|uniref:Capsule assembly Wzi family protein n=2 Tax=Aliikangiella maris TaxID=3162458 RepID=A0ABV2BNR1_9GAMM
MAAFIIKGNLKAVRLFIFIGGLLTTLVINIKLQAEPWINTQDSWLRAEIEILADYGIIRSPISTYPLPWSNIIRDIEREIDKPTSQPYLETMQSVLQIGKQATTLRSHKSIRLGVSQDESVFRSFGDITRAKTEFAIKRSSVTKHFAWNIEVTRQRSDFDNKDTRLDGSYIAGIYGNWITSIGKIERWWGPGWESSNILSNNAKAPLGIAIQRNYTESFDNRALRWLGPWNLNAFVAELDDNFHIKNAKLTGFSLTIKPLDSLEVALRTSALWGGKDIVGVDNNGKNIYQQRPESFDSLIDLFIGNQFCGEFVDNQCDDEYSLNGDRIAGFDLRWRLPLDNPLNVYYAQYGESETQLIPAKQVTQLGLSSSFKFLGSYWKWYLENSQTSNSQHNELYFSQTYPEGYEYHQRMIGSTFGKRFKVNSFGIYSKINWHNSVGLKLIEMQFNQNDDRFKKVQLQWKYLSQSYGEFNFKLERSSADIVTLGRELPNKNIVVDWVYYLN